MLLKEVDHSGMPRTLDTRRPHMLGIILIVGVVGTAKRSFREFNGFAPAVKSEHARSCLAICPATLPAARNYEVDVALHARPYLS
jgi:hypothetical protein